MGDRHDKTREVLPTRLSKTRCFILILLLIIIYTVDNSSLANNVDSFVYVYVIKPNFMDRFSINYMEISSNKAQGIFEAKENSIYMGHEFCNYLYNYKLWSRID